MTKLLEKAFAAAAKLPETEQDVLAKRWIKEVEDERRWDEAFADPRSHKLLEQLAAEAIAEDEAGDTLLLEDVLAITDK